MKLKLLPILLIALLFSTVSYGALVQSTGNVEAKTIVGRVSALVFATPLSVDMDTATVFTLTVTGDVTLNATNGKNGQWVFMRFTDDGAGPHTITFGTNFDAQSTLTTVASDVHSMIFAHDGSNWHETARTPVDAAGVTLATDVIGTANDVTITDNGDGTITISTVTLGDIVGGAGMTGGANDVLPGADADVTIGMDPASSPTLTGLTLSGLTASRIVATTAGSALTSVADLTTWLAGTSNQVIVTDDGDGTITLSLPQSIDTAATVTFGTLTAAIRNKGTGVFDVVAYGAVGDGITDDTAAIQSAITAASAGSTILFSPGTYLITSALTAAKALTFKGYGHTTSVINQTGVDAPGFDITGSGAIFEGLRLTGRQFAVVSANEIGIRFQGADSSNYLSGIRVSDCRIDNWGYMGIELLYVRRFVIEKNIIEDIFFVGISGASVEYGDIDQNTIQDITGTVSSNAYGVALSRVTSDAGELTSNPRSKFVDVTNNVVDNVTSWEGLDTHGGEDISFVNNVVKNCFVGIAVVGSKDSNGDVVYACSRITVANNRIDSGVRDGTAAEGITVGGGTVALERSAEIDITGNTVSWHGLISSATGGGIKSIFTYGLTVADNIIRNCSRNGIIFTGSNHGYSITGNSIIDPWTEASVTRGIRNIGVDNTGSVTGNTFRKTWADVVRRFAHGGITGAVPTWSSVTGKVSGATGTIGYIDSSIIIVYDITGTFQNGEQIYETIDVNFVDAGDVGTVLSSGDRAIGEDGSAGVGIVVGNNYSDYDLYIVRAAVPNVYMQELQFKVSFGTAAPATGTWAIGDRVFDQGVSAGDESYVGWVCTTAGTPGTWVEFGRLDNASHTINGTPNASYIANGDTNGDSGFTFQYLGVAKWQVFRDFTQDHDFLIVNTDLATTSLRIDRATDRIFVVNGTGIDEFSVDDTLAGNSDEALPTEQAVKTYVDASVVDLTGGITIGPGTKHDGYTVSDAFEVQTTDATANVTLATLPILDENVYCVQAFVSASQSDGTDDAVYILSCKTRRTGAGAATVGTTVSQMTDESNAALSATFIVAGNNLRLVVTGIAAETWEWGATLRYINMSN